MSAQINNYLEYLPNGYNLPANASKKYPLIVYWKGLFDYTVNDVIIKGIPQKIESGVFPQSVTYNGVQYSFIVITPMYQNAGVGAGDVDAMLNYAFANYRVDRNRVYMSGISIGGSLCYRYPNAGIQYAKKVAAIAPLAPCDPLSWSGASNVIASQTRIWGLHNPLDVTCSPSNTTTSVNNVNAQNPPVPGLAKYTFTPTTWSSDAHDIFWIPYEPGYTTPESNNKNMYDWFIQFSQNNVLPVTLKDFTARLDNGKVKLEWTTSAENNSRSFTLERAGKDMKFTSIAKLDAAGYTTAVKKYQFTDLAPLSEMNYYRLSQTDADGQTQYFDIRRVLNGSKLTAVLISPNPVRNRITAFVTIDKPQKVTVMLSDMHGRRISSMDMQYQPGLQEINMNAEHLAPGSYLLQVKGTTMNLVEKLVKQ